MKKKVIFVINILLIAVCTAFGQVSIVSATVEMQDGRQPLATDSPRFSWKYMADVSNVHQISYRIVVASTEENLLNGKGDLWDSGIVPSDQMLYVPYQGSPLHSRDMAYWRVYTTLTYGDNNDKITVESEVNEFEISLLRRDDWIAQWVGYDYDDDSLVQKTRLAARYLRKEFSLSKEVDKARLYVSGLGQYSAFLNGAEIAPDEILKPAISNYFKSVYFNAYDVTKLLRKGDNAIGVMIAGGRFFTMRHNSLELEWGGQYHVINHGNPRLLLQLEVTYMDGTTDLIVSNGSWRITNNGPIRSANEFDGETYDERMDLGSWTSTGYNDSDWQGVQSMYPPGEALVPQPNPNIQIQDTVRPIAMFRKNNAWFLDMGQNMVGYLELLMRGLTGGDTVTLRFAETLNPDSTLYTENLREADVTDYFIAGDLKGAPERRWHPTFVYHGFRYVEITGLRETPKLSDFLGLVFYDKMSTTGKFESSNEILNAVYRNAYWGIRGNYRSMPTDCPQRDERMGWTGDRTTGNYGESYIFDNHRLYAKWLIDGKESQWENGALSDVWPPYWRRHTDNMTWPGAFITVADMLYTRFGDIAPIRLHYDAMKLWMNHMKEKYMVDGILTRDCYGDWCMPPESPELVHSNDPSRITNAAAISTPFYCYLAGKMAEFARLLGKSGDEVAFRDDITFVTKSYNEKYLNRTTGCYDNNTVTANILPLWFGMVPKDMEDKVFNNIIDKTMNEFGGHVSTGVVGIQQLMRTFTEFGRGDIALKIATNDTYPSWGYMWRNGATTIWELWNGNTAAPYMNSGNHVMLLGDLILWEYEYLGGIRALEPGYRRIQLKPCYIKGLDYVKCSYESVSGHIESFWRVDGGQFVWDFTIPANTEAEVWLPIGQGYEKKTVASGKYHWVSTVE